MGSEMCIRDRFVYIRSAEDFTLAVPNYIHFTRADEVLVQFYFCVAAQDDGSGNVAEDARLPEAGKIRLLSTAQTANSKKIVRGDRQRRGQETDRREALHSSGVLLKGASDTAEEPAKRPPKTNPTFAAIYSEAGANAGPVEWARDRTEPQPPSRPSSKLSRRRQRRTCSPDLKTSSSTAAATATTGRFSALVESEVRKVFDDGADAARSSFRP